MRSSVVHLGSITGPLSEEQRVRLAEIARELADITGALIEVRVMWRGVDYVFAQYPLRPAE